MSFPQKCKYGPLEKMIELESDHNLQRRFLPNIGQHEFIKFRLSKISIYITISLFYLFKIISKIIY